MNVTQHSNRLGTSVSLAFAIVITSRLSLRRVAKNENVSIAISIGIDHH